ncbi:unnamed protein product, partial [Ectocarpus sp. 12 AP-2014]
MSVRRLFISRPALVALEALFDFFPSLLRQLVMVHVLPRSIWPQLHPYRCGSSISRPTLLAELFDFFPPLLRQLVIVNGQVTPFALHSSPAPACQTSPDLEPDTFIRRHQNSWRQWPNLTMNLRGSTSSTLLRCTAYPLCLVSRKRRSPPAIFSYMLSVRLCVREVCIELRGKRVVTCPRAD